jgi:ABC-2 type transport system permease protein
MSSCSSSWSLRCSFSSAAWLPGWLQAIADWNPVSAVTAGARQLWDNPNPSAWVAAWPMQHPIEASLALSALILAVAAPLASRYFRRRTTE